MAEYITGMRTVTGYKKFDYNALANLPPKTHGSSHELGGSDQITADMIGAVTVEDGYLQPMIVVNSDAESVVCTCGDTVIEAREDDGVLIYDVPDFGEYVVTASSNATDKNGDATVVSKTYNVSMNEIRRHQIDVLSLNVGTLEETAWETISYISELGLGQNYWSVGDTKSVYLKGSVGSACELDDTLYVYIIGFDHNSEYEGTGIHFGGFKKPDSTGAFKDVALCDEKYYVYSDGTNNPDGEIWFFIDWISLYYAPSWESCVMRQYILGANSAINPTPNTLMAALPNTLRNVIKPMYKNTGGDPALWQTKDYLSLLSEYEILGRRDMAVEVESKYNKQYDYYASGNSTFKYHHTIEDKKVKYWLRSDYYDANCSLWINVQDNQENATSAMGSLYSLGVAPIFKV